MFKGLRDRLKGVSEKLEDELEARLEAELEAELAGMGADPDASPTPQAETADRERPAAESDTEARPPVEKADSVAPSTHPDQASQAPTDKAESTPPVQAAEEETASPSQATPGSEPPLRTDAPASATEHTPGSQEPPADSGSTGPPEPAPDSSRLATAPDPSPPAPTPSPTQVPAPEPATPLAAAKPETIEAPPVRESPAPVPAQTPPPPKTQQPITGRKMLSAEEIEARLKAELEEAVETQKEVETVVQGAGIRARRYTINEEVLEDILWELEVGLLESDVALPVIEAIKENVKEQLLSMSVAGKSANDVVEKVLRAAVRRVLNVGRIDFDAFVREKLAAGKRPVVVMFVGVNGTGKTTSIARIAHRLKEQGLSPVLAAGDTFRAGAIEQLTQHADKLGVKVVKHSAGADPAAVAYDAIEHAKARRKDVVLLDTAGRMQTNTNLMDEMDKIRRVANPDLVVFVGDSLAGNDAVEQARRFDQVVDIDGAILTKVDVDAKGGAALSVAYTVNKPLLFVGVGQGYADLQPFDAGWMVDRLFGAEGDEEAVVAT